MNALRKVISESALTARPRPKFLTSPPTHILYNGHVVQPAIAGKLLPTIQPSGNEPILTFRTPRAPKRQLILPHNQWTRAEYQVLMDSIGDQNITPDSATEYDVQRRWTKGIDWQRVSDNLPYRSPRDCRVAAAFILRKNTAAILDAGYNEEVQVESPLPMDGQHQSPALWTRRKRIMLRRCVLGSQQPSPQVTQHPRGRSVDWNVVSMIVGESAGKCRLEFQRQQEQCVDRW